MLEFPSLTRLGCDLRFVRFRQMKRDGRVAAKSTSNVPDGIFRAIASNQRKEAQRGRRLINIYERNEPQ